MPKGILIDADAFVANWVFTEYGKVQISVDRAIGIIDDGQLVGAAIFSNFNTMNADLSYYGKWTMSVGIIRALGRIALYELQLTRLTVIVPKRPAFLLRKLGNGLFGFRYEGVQRRYYGPTDSARHVGCRFVLFREDMERLISESVEKVA